jgi:hypothetical protein
MIRLSNQDDVREDLELAVMELQDRFGVAPSSIRRFVNSSLRAREDADGVRATKFLRQRWARLGEPIEDPSRPVGNARSRSETVPGAEDGDSDLPRRSLSSRADTGTAEALLAGSGC